MAIKDLNASSHGVPNDTQMTSLQLHPNTHHHGNGRHVTPSSANSSTRLTSISGIMALQYQQSSSPDQTDSDSELDPDDVTPPLGVPYDVTTHSGVPYGVTVPSLPPRRPKGAKKAVGAKSQGHTIIVITDAQEARQRRIGNVVFSCFVFWCCNAFFGAAAFFVALSSTDAKAREARRLGNVALALNVTGIAISWIIVALVVSLWWFGVIYIPFAPWRIQHYYGDKYLGDIHVNSGP